jgi:hypothetical protein
VSLDTHGVGPLVHLAIKRARATNATLKVIVLSYCFDIVMVEFFHFRLVYAESMRVTLALFDSFITKVSKVCLVLHIKSR